MMLKKMLKAEREMHNERTEPVLSLIILRPGLVCLDAALAPGRCEKMDYHIFTTPMLQRLVAWSGSCMVGSGTIS